MNSNDFYNKCYNLLLEIKPRDVDLEKYFVGYAKGFQTLQDIFYRLTISARNYRSMPNVIDYTHRKETIDDILFKYDYTKILNNYNVDSLYRKFRKTFNITSADTKMNAWFKWSNSIIDSAKFISKFNNIEEFKKFVECYSFNTYTRGSLPMLIEKEIKGIGFALACDFLKELGYTEYCKPDVHIIDILNAIDNTKYEPYQAFKRLVQISLDVNVTPYKLDKIIWLLCSGSYYMDGIKIA